MTDTIILPRFMDHPSVTQNPGPYGNAMIDVGKAMASWRLSLLAHQWLDEKGMPKGPDLLSEAQAAQRAEIMDIIARGQALPKPIVGLGILDTIEIGSGAGVFATLASMGAPLLPVHVRRSQEKLLRAFLVNV